MSNVRIILNDEEKSGRGLFDSILFKVLREKRKLSFNSRSPGPNLFGVIDNTS